MKNSFYEDSSGFQKILSDGVEAVRNLQGGFTRGSGSLEENMHRLKEALKTTDIIVIGAGAGLSTAAGFTYSGKRFYKYFFDFADQYGIKDMYSGGFYPFPDEETRWAWWARYIYFNRYVKAPKPVYDDLFMLVKDKDYFVIITNVDHQFQRAGFDKSRLFYTQGDYGLFQSVNPDIRKTYDNEQWVMKAMEAEGFVKGEDGEYHIPEDRNLKMKLPENLIPHCPDDGSDVTMNLRADDSFVEDEGWHKAAKAYADFISGHQKGPVLYLELGVGANTPMIIKFPFWDLTEKNQEATYACINLNEAFCPKEIEGRSICLNISIDKFAHNSPF